MDIEERAAFLILLEETKHWGAICEQVEESGSALDVLLAMAHGKSRRQGKASGRGPGQGQHQGYHQGYHQGQQALLPGLDYHEQIAKASEKLLAWENQGIHFAAFFESHYPYQLLTIRERPPFVTWCGTPNDTDAYGIAVIGTRQPSNHGIATAQAIAGALTRRNITVISGLAAGIDTAAHLATIEAGGRTVAVVGTGLLHTYPPANRVLQSRIADSSMVLSQFLPDTPPAKSNFPMRNAVMSGYASATIVVEASWRSGARTQARLATLHGRPVYLMESVVTTNEWAREYANRPGVHVVRDVEDFVSHLEGQTIYGKVSEFPDKLVW